MPGGRALAVVLILAAAVLAAPAAASAQTGGNPLEGVRLFVDHTSKAWHQWEAYRRSGQDRKAGLIWKIAREPKALWVGRYVPTPLHAEIRRHIRMARRANAVPIFTVMRAIADGCYPGYTGGDAAEDARTRGWYRALARTIGGARVVIAFEPDSLGTIDCLTPSRRDDRIRVLRDGVRTFSRLPNATIYLEAGASDWEPARRTARQLRAIGIRRVRGFMLNSTHQDWTRANIRHGLAISRRVGGKPFVINTAENGRGPVQYRRSNGRRITVWCNPGMRGLGPPPTTNTSHPKVDAYLWINRPGYAQGCAGQKIDWFAPRALSYARFATNWESPPPGTRYGFRKRFPPRVFGVPR